MADLSLADLQSVADVEPDTFFLNAGGDISINVKKLLTGEITGTDLAEAVVTAIMFKLIELGLDAQATYNTTAPAGESIATFSEPSRTSVVELDDGSQQYNVTATLLGTTPLVTSATEARLT